MGFLSDIFGGGDIDIPKPELVIDPTLERIRRKEADVGLGMLEGQIPEYYRPIGEIGGETFEDYIKAKLRILLNLSRDDYLIYNGDDNFLQKRIASCQAKKLYFSLIDEKANAFIKEDTIFLEKKRLIPTSQILLKGAHNYMNAMAACLAAKCASISDNSIVGVLQTFKGVVHRLENVATIRDIRFINDSKATTIESLTVALKSFDTPIILIAGGKDKGSDYSRINELIRKMISQLGEDISGEAIVTNIRHGELLQRALESMERASKSLKDIPSVEYALSDMKKALNSIGELTGEISMDDIYDRIFAKFCLGK